MPIGDINSIFNWTPPHFDFLGMTVPSFIRVRADDVKRRFNVSLIKNQGERMILKMKPRGEPESLDWYAIMVIWSREKRRVHAVKLIDPSQNLEIVYVVKNYLIDPPLDVHDVMNPSYPDYSIVVHPSK
jgi:hypothetical protein